jgi:hypothetical protein
MLLLTLEAYLTLEYHEIQRLRKEVSARVPFLSACLRPDILPLRDHGENDI